MKRSRSILFVRSGDWARGRTAGVLLGVALVAAAGPAASAQTFTGIGFLPGGTTSFARAISADSSTVVGHAGTFSETRAFRWNSAEGMENLGILPGYTRSRAFDVSGDGAVVVGMLDSFSGFRWTSEDGMQLIRPSTSYLTANAVSDDGTTIVGGTGFGGYVHAYRWTSASGIQDLGVLPGGNWSHAGGVNSDGSVIAGSATVGDIAHVFRWTSSEGMEDLGPIPNQDDPFVTAVSSDGSTIVGYGNIGGRAFLWTRESGIRLLPRLPNTLGREEPNDVSADGSIIVGSRITNDSLSRATLWHSSGRVEDFNSYLTAIGIDLSGWTLLDASGVSADGYTIAGGGTNPDGHQEAWIATLTTCRADFNRDFFVDSQDFFDFLTVFFASDPGADINGDGAVDSGDFFEFLDAFFAGGCS